MERIKIIASRHTIIVAYCMSISNGVYKKLKSPMYVGENIKNTYTEWFKDVCPAIRDIAPVLVNEEPCIQVEMWISEELLNNNSLQTPIRSLINLQSAAIAICKIIIELISTETRIKNVYSDIRHLYETEESTKPTTQATTNG